MGNCLQPVSTARAWTPDSRLQSMRSQTLIPEPRPQILHHRPIFLCLAQSFPHQTLHPIPHPGSPRCPSAAVPQETMGIAANFSQWDWDDFWPEMEMNESYYSENMNDSDMASAAPCYSCNLLDASSLPFFLLSSVLGLLTSAAFLLALLWPLFHGQRCTDWPVLAQLAMGSALSSLSLPLRAPGLSGARPVPLCHLTHIAWYGGAFTQALLIVSRACLGSRLSVSQSRYLLLGYSVGLWVTATLLGLPNALTSDSSSGYCAQSQGWGPLYSVHVAFCWCLFVMLPLGLVCVKGLQKALGKGPYPQVDVLWVWFIFWGPYGVMLGVDSLMRSRAVVLPSCQAQQVQDLLLQLAEGLTMLHCVATPMLLALACHQATRLITPALPLAPYPYPNSPVSKS